MRSRAVRSLLWGLVPAWLGVEAGFHVLYRRREAELSAQSYSAPQHLLPSTMARILHCCGQNRWGAAEYREFLEEWFLNASFESIHRGNVEEWLSYMLYSSPPAKLPVPEQRILGGMVDELETRLGRPFPEGRNPDLRAMRHSMDPIQALPLPLVLYLAIGALNVVAHGVLRQMGFMRCEAGPLRAWYRSSGEVAPHLADGADGERSARSAEPVVFIGGLGIGMLPYLPFTRRVVRETGRPMFIIEMPQVNLSLSNFWHPTANVPTIEAAVEGLHTMLRSAGFSQGCFMAHSYGTIYISWVLKTLPELAQGGTVFIDPVPLLLFEPDVIANMLYRNSVSGPLSALIRGDLHVRYTVQRHFWWQKNMLFADELPEKTAVMLGSTDNMIPSHKVYRYLNEICDLPHKPVCKMYNTRHGGVLWTWAMQDEIIAAMNRWREDTPAAVPRRLPPVQLFHDYATQTSP